MVRKSSVLVVLTISVVPSELLDELQSTATIDEVDCASAIGGEKTSAENTKMFYLRSGNYPTTIVMFLQIFFSIC